MSCLTIIVHPLMYVLLESHISRKLYIYLYKNKLRREQKLTFRQNNPCLPVQTKNRVQWLKNLSAHEIVYILFLDVRLFACSINNTPAAWSLHDQRQRQLLAAYNEPLFAMSDGW